MGDLAKALPTPPTIFWSQITKSFGRVPDASKGHLSAMPQQFNMYISKNLPNDFHVWNLKTEVRESNALRMYTLRNGYFW